MEYPTVTSEGLNEFDGDDNAYDANQFIQNQQEFLEQLEQNFKNQQQLSSQHQQQLLEQ
ncbi:16955_t:CDS:1, partial [Entrophospora sp. SA101]